MNQTSPESWRPAGVVAGELEASAEAARPYAEGVGDLDVPTHSWAVGQGFIGRNMLDRIPSGSYS